MSSPEPNQSPETKKRRLEEASQLVSDSLATVKGKLGEAKHALMGHEKIVQAQEKKLQDADKRVQDADKRVQDADKRVQDADKKVQDADKKVQDDTGDISALQDELHTAKKMLQIALQQLENALQEQKGLIAVYQDLIAAYLRCKSDVADFEQEIVKLNAKQSSVTEHKINLMIGRRLVGSNPRQKRWDELNTLISSDGVNEAFSSLKKKNCIAALFEGYTSHYQQSKKSIPSEDLKLLCRCLSVFNSTKSYGNLPESLICHFIYAIIAVVCHHCEGARIAIEETICGETVLAHGKFEFMIKFGTISICFVESKAESLSEGIIQGLTGSEVIAELENLTTTLCIVTTYRDWIFFKNYEEKITRYDFHLDMESSGSLEPKEDSLETLTGLLFSFLTDL